ncbi:TPA: outer membrane lipoprotein carrier protein LolA [Burkholderia territorii]|uniref:LolA family protein n=1 Tax=Burkholderia territorii TaxID=1503055 RepID=UPI0011C97213|nr:outer membrane lipoprotein carrier protein LolA [Burkholderia territorii]TXG10120.1 outer membrane lipoprotein carrier protein LolA [Burkholderia territorii]HDR8857013.1 outer membrane lipoprotein carrier protein LolA [Burkholderia territorii]HDR8862951.1 outer membrane lipoprotein carrier protein LolA [Burkholderia territorii]HDR8869230.1 outer membrane lipoprotein carrier protein LolA [Burkholderia territorii]HDR8875664.1 outer membrane lipoprotein carrier protein LolA [Burkholderia terri
MGLNSRYRRFAAVTLAAGIALSGCAALAAPAPVAASRPANAALVSEVAARLARVGAIRADFRQTQTLAAMKQPLVSTGSMLFDRRSGVVWRVETPYKAAYVITDNGVREVGADGHLVAPGGGGRGVAQVSRMMRDMLGGDLSALYAQFDVDASGTPERWRMVLRPNQPQLAQAVRVLEMSGGTYLGRLELTFANGNVTALEFARPTPVEEPAPVERAWLEAR